MPPSSSIVTVFTSPGNASSSTCGRGNGGAPNLTRPQPACFTAKPAEAALLRGGRRTPPRQAKLSIVAGTRLMAPGARPFLHPILHAFGPTSADRASSTMAKGSSRAAGGGRKVNRVRRRSCNASVVTAIGVVVALAADPPGVSSSMPPSALLPAALPCSSPALQAPRRAAHSRGASTSADNGSSATTRGGPAVRRASSTAARFCSRCCRAAFSRSALLCAPLRAALMPGRAPASAGVAAWAAWVRMSAVSRATAWRHTRHVTWHVPVRCRLQGSSGGVRGSRRSGVKLAESQR